jgi:DNA-binding MarR family transcriptional regulator
MEILPWLVPLRPFPKMPDFLRPSQTRKGRDRSRSRPGRRSHIVDLDNNSVNTTMPRPARATEDRMTGSSNPRRKSSALRSRIPTRRSPRPAIALDTLDNHLGYFIRRLQVWIFQDFIRTLAPIHLSPAQFSVLVIVSANRGLSQAELASTLAIERARLVRLLHRLQSRGLIARLRSSADGRRHELELTPQGHAVLTQAKILGARHQKRLIEKLGADRHGILLRALREP